MLNPMKLYGIAGVLAVGIAGTPAMAAAPVGVAGTLGGGYSNSSLDCSGCGHSDNWGFSGQAAFGFGANDLAGEIDGGYSHSSFSGGGGDSDSYGIGGALFWSPDVFRVGGQVNWARTNLPSGLPDVDTVVYGGFGEFFASEFLTVGGGLGGVHISFAGASANAFYLNGGATGYITPDFAITGAFQWADFNQGIGSISAISIGGEWLISEALPISINGGYTRGFLPNSLPDDNIWSVGLKFYFGGDGMPLVGHHRNGSLDTLPSINTVVFQSIF